VIQSILERKVPIIIAVSFFLFGFFVTADLLGLSLREIVIGVAAGAVGGLTTLIVVLREARKIPAEAPAAVVNP
jgi:hypothetical protein